MCPLPRSSGSRGAYRSVIIVCSYPVCLGQLWSDEGSVQVVYHAGSAVPVNSRVGGWEIVSDLAYSLRVTVEGWSCRALPPLSPSADGGPTSLVPLCGVNDSSEVVRQNRSASVANNQDPISPGSALVLESVLVLP